MPWEDFLAKLGDLPTWMRDWLDGRRTQLTPVLEAAPAADLRLPRP